MVPFLLIGAKSGTISQKIPFKHSRKEKLVLCFHLIALNDWFSVCVCPVLGSDQFSVPVSLAM